MQNKIILFLLSSNVNTDVFFELFIRKIRTDLLRNFTIYKNLKNFRIFYNALSKQLYLNEFIYDDQIMLLSHTVTPEIDSVSVLKDYSIENGVLDSKWNLVTGDKKQIYNLARKSYLVAEDIESELKYDMIHTENFVLIDPLRRIRGFYDGTNDDSIDKLIEDIYLLKQEF